MNTADYKLDDADRRILRVLQQDGRITNQDLASACNIFDQFADRIRRSPEVLECHMVAGGFDYLVKVRMKDMAAYRVFLADTLITMPGVRETRTYAVMEEVKDTSVLPL